MFNDLYTHVVTQARQPLPKRGVKRKGSLVLINRPLRPVRVQESEVQNSVYRPGLFRVGDPSEAVRESFQITQEKGIRIKFNKGSSWGKKSLRDEHEMQHPDLELFVYLRHHLVLRLT